MVGIKKLIQEAKTLQVEAQTQVNELKETQVTEKAESE